MHISLAILAAIASLLATGDKSPSDAVPPVTIATSIRLIERGAILTEDFAAKGLDRTKWRVWQENADHTTVVQETGRLSLTARGPIGHHFLCRVTLNGDTNLTELSAKTAAGWQRICDPIELPLRTIHTEVKLHGSPGTAGAEETSSLAWFDNVRIYPRPENYHVGMT